MNIFRWYILRLFALGIASFFCVQWQVLQAQEQADLLITNARVYAVDGQFSIAEAVAVKNGRIVAIGSSKDLRTRWKASQTLDAKGKFVYPGFYDAHAHLYNYGRTLQNADLQGTTSFKQVLERLKAYRKANPQARWMLGRGWDQNDWAVKTFPTKEPLDSLFPDIPVCLTRIDGHALLANSKALALAGITEETRVEGGLVEKVNGRLTGIVLDNAMDKVYMRIPSPTQQEIEDAILAAEKRCFAVGLTSVAEAGISHEIVETYKKLYAEKRLNMRVYAMLTPTDENVERYLKQGVLQTDYLTVRSFKVLADGALGSRGACLLEPYADKPSTRGFLTIDAAWMERFVEKVSKTSFQINTHCIGDSANRIILDLYGKYLGGTDKRTAQKNKRWRIEHAQVVNRADISKFREYGIIPSVQPTHCTSDMTWAGERLGAERIKTAYSFNDLYEQRGIIALGSDFPVEDINPLYGFHAAVARQDAQNKPKGGFQPEQALSRETALRGMTIYAAIAGFEEHLKGSLEVGKLADMVILDTDIMTAPPEKLRSAKVLYTVSGGKIVFKR
ncbi:MAG: amidohydrolase family protein [Candidatus Kapabacteria bacterium]|jgi:hypothetical protein|nr:amidohydrolase family protein [Candidatus Kapabacteria bacterium]